MTFETKRLFQPYTAEIELTPVERQLRDTEARYRGLVSAMSEMVWTTEPDGRPKDARAWMDYTGMPREQMEREGWMAAIHPQDVPILAASWRNSIATGTPFESMIRIRRHDGVYRWFKGSSAPLRDSAGVIREWVGIAIDVEEQRRTEDALRLSNQRLRDVICLQQEIAQRANDRHAITTLVTERARRLLGADVMVVDDHLRAANPAALGDDERRMLELLAGILASALTTARVHEVKLASERALAFQAMLLDTVEQSVVAADLDGRVTYWNAYAEKQFGWRAEEVMGKPVRELMVPASFRDEAAAIRQRVLNGEHFVGDYQLTRRDGSVFTAQVSNTVLRADDGRPIGFIGVSRDVTKERELENQLRHSQKLQAVGQLAGGVAHDFNNILTAISGYAELVRTAVNDAKIGTDVDEIRHAARRGADLTRQLLSFSRKQLLQPSAFDGGQVIRAMENMLRRVLRADIDFVVDVSQEPLPLYADASQLEQVLLNLVVNARDAIEGPGRIVLRAAPAPDGRMMLEVRDTGAGMSQATKARLFEPFFTTKPAGKGTGLGLAVVHGIVQQMHGTIAVESAPGAGTSFVLTLPLSQEVLAAESRARSSRPTPRQSGETVLLVEDNKALLVLCRRVLEREGYAVLCADTPEHALAVTASTRVDLVITDIVMPEMNGTTMVERLTERGIRAPVIFMSGYTEDAAINEGRARERSAFLAKPFAPADLVRTVRQVLDTYGSQLAA